MRNFVLCGIYYVKDFRKFFQKNGNRNKLYIRVIVLAREFECEYNFKI